MIAPAKHRHTRALLSLAALCTAAVHARAAAPAVPQIFSSPFINEFDPNSSVSEDSTGIALDSRGNVIVTGYQFEADDTTRFFYTAKYDALDGHLDWSKTFPAAGDAPANAVAVDSQGNVYVGGGAILTAGSNEFFYLIKYSGTDGSTLWSQSYNGTASGQNEIRKVIVDPNDNVIVTGISAGTSEGLDFETIKYNSSGVQQWAQRFDYDQQDDVPSGLACDRTGNIYVVGSATGASQSQVFVTLAYTAAGALSWTGTYQSPAAGDDGATYGATAVAVDSAGNVITTGHYTDTSSPPNDGFYTIKYAGASGSVPGAVVWTALLSSTGIVTTGHGGATSVAVDGDDNVLVTGALNNGLSGPANTDQINVAKYSGSNGSLLWSITDSGTSGGPSHAVQITTDGGGNAIIVGDAYDSTAGAQDIYVAKYDQGTGNQIWYAYYAGSYDADAFGKAVATDANGNIDITGVPFRNDPNDAGIGLNEFVTIKYDRFLLETNDPLPASPDLAANPTIFTIDPPALADGNGFATLVTVNSGNAKPTAILTEDAGGGIQLPAVQKGAAGSGGTFARFSDPVSAPDGSYAFVAKLAGVPASQANGVWSTISGTLGLVLQQGSPVPGAPSANVAAINSLSMRNGQLLALLTVSGPSATKSLLLGIDPSLTGTPLVRSGQAITLGGNSTTVKTITALTPTLLSPGDGRWQGDANAVVKILAANRATAICSVSTSGSLTALLYTGEDASSVVSGATWKGFGLPGIDPAGVYYTTLATLKGSITAADNTVLVTSSGGGAFTPYLQAGGAPTDPTLAGLTFTGLTDPIVNSSGDLATIVSLAGPGVSPKNKQVLLYGNLSKGLTAIARLGDTATGPDGNADTPTYVSFVDFALPSGVEPAPVFVAKLSGAGVTPKTNMGLWAYGTGGAIRRLLRTGDTLGTRTVDSFTVLKAPSKSFAAARNFNATAQVAVMITFTDKTEALINIGIP